MSTTKPSWEEWKLQQLRNIVWRATPHLNKRRNEFGERQVLHLMTARDETAYVCIDSIDEADLLAKLPPEMRAELADLK